jgi:hypothetical protein
MQSQNGQEPVQIVNQQKWCRWRSCITWSPKNEKKTLLISIWGVYPESERGQDAKTHAWSLTTNSFNCFKPWLRRGLEKVNAGLKNVSSPSKTASWLTVHPGSIMIHQHQLGLCQETQGLSSIRWMQERSLCVWHQVIETCPLLPCRPTKKVSLSWRCPQVPVTWHPRIFCWFLRNFWLRTSEEVGIHPNWSLIRIAKA